MFKVGDGFVMDTLGLTSLGMLDLQIEFRELDLEDVGRDLYDLAVAQVMAGPAAHVACGSPLEDGELIDGPDGRAALCRWEMAQVGPKRGVIDIARWTGQDERSDD